MDTADPFAPDQRADPYPAYAALRSRGALVRHDRLGFWIATTAESVQAVLTDADHFTSQKGIGQARNEVIQRPTMLTRDPPDHTRLRSLVNRAFTPRRIAALEPRILEVVTRQIDAGLANGRLDLVGDFARPLPTVVLSELLSVEPERLPDLMRWSDDIFKSVAGLGKKHDRERTRQSYLEFDEYFTRKVEDRHAERRGDLLGELVAAHDDFAALSTTEILSFCMLLFIAGTETTTNLITNAVLALIAHPEEERKFRADPSLVTGLVEETLRYDSPVQGIFRTTRKEVDRFGAQIPADEKVCALIASANRDPALFSDPDRFDITRAAGAHVAFGHGVHYCLGASLARLEAKVALGELFRRARAITPDPAGGSKRVEAAMVRGMESYPVLLAAA